MGDGRREREKESVCSRQSGKCAWRERVLIARMLGLRIVSQLFPLLNEFFIDCHVWVISFSLSLLLYVVCVSEHHSNHLTWWGSLLKENVRTGRLSGRTGV